MRNSQIISEKKRIVPLLLKFKKPIKKPNIHYRYDESLSVNTAIYNGSKIPEVLLPGSLSKIKTVMKSGGED